MKQYGAGSSDFIGVRARVASGESAELRDARKRIQLLDPHIESVGSAMPKRSATEPSDRGQTCFPRQPSGPQPCTGPFFAARRQAVMRAPFELVD